MSLLFEFDKFSIYPFNFEYKSYGRELPVVTTCKSFKNLLNIFHSSDNEKNLCRTSKYFLNQSLSR
jgi:hypothetical protein